MEKEITFIHNSRDYRKNIFYIQLFLFKACNYKCEYCITKSNTDDINKENLVKGFKNLDKFIKGHSEKHKDIDTTSIQVIGGEPTLIDLIPYLDMINSKSFKIFKLMTNFYRPINYFEDLYNYKIKRDLDIQFTLSFHALKMDKNEFFEKYKLLTQMFEKKNVNISIVVNDTNINKVKEFVSDVKETGIIDFKKMKFKKDFTKNQVSKEVSDFVDEMILTKPWPETSLIKYNDGSIDEVNLNKIRCIYGKYDFNPQGFHCETKLGKNHCKIDFKTGNIYFCKRCMDKKECIGNLFENKYNFDITDDICISKTCNFCNRGDKIYK